MNDQRHSLLPRSPRWTHIALPSTDIDASIAWYEKYTPMRLLDRREDADGYGAWLGHPDMGDKPFVLVLVSFFRDQDKGPQPTMAPFAHIGIELPTEQAVREELAALALSLPFALLIGLTWERRLQLIAVVMLVLIVELLNTAIEKLADRVTTDAHERVVHSHGSSVTELLHVSRGDYGRLADVVVYPRDAAEVKALLLRGGGAISGAPAGGGGATDAELDGQWGDRDVKKDPPRWTKAGGRTLRGLVRRRQAERALFLEGAK